MLRISKRCYSISERVYHQYANKYLDDLQCVLEDLGDDLDIKGYDVLYSTGVLTLTLGQKGTYVINKQPPNKQIWLSSPISGPKRYDLDQAQGIWVNTKDKSSIKALLDKELSKLLSVSVETP